jgi:hypothetical protein
MFKYSESSPDKIGMRLQNPFTPTPICNTLPDNAHSRAVRY